MQTPQNTEPEPPASAPLASAFVSNCGAQQRKHYLEELMKHIKIDSFGGCLRNKQETSIETKRHDKYGRKMQVMQKYKFHLSFENSQLTDYVSEKYYQVGGHLLGLAPSRSFSSPPPPFPSPL